MGIIQKIKIRLQDYGLMRTLAYSLWHGSSGFIRKRVVQVTKKFLSLSKKDRLLRVNDTKMYVNFTDEWVTREYYIHGKLDFEEIKQARECISQEYTFFDLGANYGAWSFSLAKYFRSICIVEPDPRCFRCLEKTKNYHQADWIQLVNAGLSDSVGDGEYFQSSSHGGDGRIYDPSDVDRGKGEKMKILTLDHIVEEYKLDCKKMFIKLDVQGVEHLVFKGMVKSLAQAEDVILFIEICKSLLELHGLSVKSYVELLKGLGFFPVESFNSSTPMSWEDFIQAIDQNKQRDYYLKYRSSKVS